MSMPKIVISATGDEFFQPDDSYNWFDEMPGKTYVRLLPNAEHAMIPPQALSSPSIIHTISYGFFNWLYAVHTMHGRNLRSPLVDKP